MVRAVLSLYVRAGVGVANLALRAAARSADLAAGAVRIAVPWTGQPARGGSEDVFGQPAAAPSEPPHAAERPPEPPRPVEPAPEPPRPVEPAPDLPRQAEPPETPRAADLDQGAPQPLADAEERAKTIDDEPELVAELAESGAEDGASAELEVDEPWQGYDDLTADEITARIADADAAALAVVELYERSNKQRRTVLTAAERRQRELANAPS